MRTLTPQVFRLPDLGEGLTEAGLVQWLVAVGDTIVVDQAIAEVETAKSIVELPSPYAGVVTALHGEPGETIDVGAPVLEVTPAEALRALSETASTRSLSERSETKRPDPTATPAADAEHEAYRTEERAGSGNVLIGYGTSERGGIGRRRRPAAKHASAPAPAPAGPSVSRTVASSAADETTAVHEPPSPRRTVAVRSPIVRRLARDLGLDVHTLNGTGSDGAITRADVLRAAVDHAVDGVGAPASAPASKAAGTATDGASTEGEIDGLPVRSTTRMSPLRKAANATMSRSRAEIPEATVWVDVDATALWDARREMAPEGGRAPSITALIARFVLIALEEHPLLASRLSPDATEVIEFDGVNLGIAADTPRGLMVPVIPRAQSLRTAELDATLRELAETARAGSMPPERLRGSTFTLNNYGGFGVDGSAAIINHPNVAILGIGRILERPWVVDGQIVARRIAQLSLVFDHRVCDGGYAAGFLRRVTELIEHPLRAFGRL
ncbi:dihydrolipoamide acetyltransferase family protein [Microbacterium sp. SD291]|uniref:dihydrolipoamide acetyltransferase family protein n=1 Tax=Microbacterium sp. SD291 TaxID=2782007 RepID=UPI001A9646D2|nr:dihydrolipoamide acetyltransferase family protein [Microbacterium sp. SD291]MBO0980119.1 2-oxo acid dehydrogenase subunit E2 [Microbacterium sp. SD291]